MYVMIQRNEVGTEGHLVPGDPLFLFIDGGKVEAGEVIFPTPCARLEHEAFAGASDKLRVVALEPARKHRPEKKRVSWQKKKTA